MPNDKNGEALRRMQAGGDDLSEARRMDFAFVFPERRQAVLFAGLVEEPDMAVSISFYAGRSCWQAIVHHHMVPTYTAITALETELASRALSAGGKADGWTGFKIEKKPH